MKTDLIFLPDKVSFNTTDVLIEPNKLIFKNSNTNYKKNKLLFNLPKQIINPKSITLLPTFNCNLKCIYCYSKGGKSKKNLNMFYVKKVLDYISEKRKDINIKFAGGGEPFVNFDLMKKAVNYAKKKFQKVSVYVITNGTFNNEQFNWLKNIKAFVRISFDGLSQNFQRPFRNGEASYNIVLKNIKHLVKSKNKLVIQTVVTSKNVNLMNEIINELALLNIKYVKFEPVHISSESRGTNDLSVKPEVFVSNYIKLLKEIYRLNMDIKIDSSFFSRPSLGFFCSMPMGNWILTPEGYLTSCVEISKKSDVLSNKLFWGQVTNKGIIINKNILEKLNKFHFNKYQECSKCNLKLICKGGCPIRRIWGDLDKQYSHKSFCTISKLLIPRILELISEDNRYIEILSSDFTIL